MNQHPHLQVGGGPNPRDMWQFAQRDRVSEKMRARICPLASYFPPSSWDSMTSPLSQPLADPHLSFSTVSMSTLPKHLEKPQPGSCHGFWAPYTWAAELCLRISDDLPGWCHHKFTTVRLNGALDSAGGPLSHKVSALVNHSSTPLYFQPHHISPWHSILLKWTPLTGKPLTFPSPGLWIYLHPHPRFPSPLWTLPPLKELILCLVPSLLHLSFFSEILPCHQPLRQLRQVVPVFKNQTDFLPLSPCPLLQPRHLYAHYLRSPPQLACYLRYTTVFSPGDPIAVKLHRVLTLLDSIWPCSAVLYFWKHHLDLCED